MLKTGSKRNSLLNGPLLGSHRKEHNMTRRLEPTTKHARIIHRLFLKIHRRMFKEWMVAENVFKTPIALNRDEVKIVTSFLGCNKHGKWLGEVSTKSSDPTGWVSKINGLPIYRLRIMNMDGTCTLFSFVKQNPNKRIDGRLTAGAQRARNGAQVTYVINNDLRKMVCKVEGREVTWR